MDRSVEVEFPINTSAASSCSASTLLQGAPRPDEDIFAVTRVVSTLMSAIELMFEACQSRWRTGDVLARPR
jgi:hypothetical protein